MTDQHEGDPMRSEQSGTVTGKGKDNGGEYREAPMTDQIARRTVESERAEAERNAFVHKRENLSMEGKITHALDRVHRLEEELAQVRRLLWCAIASVGGEVRINEETAQRVNNYCAVLRDDDMRTRQIVLRSHP